jgi:ATP-dependent DNA helicase RecG
MLEAAGLPEPIIEELAGKIQVTFQKDIYTEDYLKGLNLDERQVQAVLYAKREKNEQLL